MLVELFIGTGKQESIIVGKNDVITADNGVVQVDEDDITVDSG